MGQVVEGLTILRYPGVHKKVVNHPQKRIFSIYSQSFQDTKFKLLRKVKDSMGQVMKELKILSYHGVHEKGVNHHPKTYIQHVFD